MSQQVDIRDRPLIPDKTGHTTKQEEESPDLTTSMKALRNMSGSLRVVNVAIVKNVTRKEKNTPKFQDLEKTEELSKLCLFRRVFSVAAKGERAGNLLENWVLKESRFDREGKNMSGKLAKMRKTKEGKD